MSKKYVFDELDTVYDDKISEMLKSDVSDIDIVSIKASVKEKIHASEEKKKPRSKRIVFGLIAAVIIVVSSASLIAIANSGKGNIGIYEKNNYNKEASETSLCYDRSYEESTYEGKMRKQLYDEYNSILFEIYDSLDDKDYEKYPEDFRQSHKYFDARQKTKKQLYEKIYEIVEKYSGYKVDPTDQHRESVNELIESCCGIINDINIDITVEDRTRLVFYLEEMHTILTKSDYEQTNRDKEDIALIENTIITKPSGEIYPYNPL